MVMVPTPAGSDGYGHDASLSYDGNSQKQQHDPQIAHGAPPYCIRRATRCVHFLDRLSASVDIGAKAGRAARAADDGKLWACQCKNLPPGSQCFAPYRVFRVHLMRSAYLANVLLSGT